LDQQAGRHQHNRQRGTSVNSHAGCLKVVDTRRPLLRVVVRSIGHVASRCYPAARSGTSRTPVRAQFPRPLPNSTGNKAGSREGKPRFRGTEVRSVPLPDRTSVRRSATSPIGLTGSRFSRFVWLSYSQSAIFGRPPGIESFPGSVSREMRKLPTPAWLNKP